MPSIEQMRYEVTHARFGANWGYRVEKMSDKQVAAIYARMVSAKEIKN